MDINLKYYKSGRLILTVLVLAVTYTVLHSALSEVIIVPESFNELLAMLNGYLGWVSPIAFIGAVLYCINAYLWKYSWMHWLIDLPDLNGRYKGELVSSYTGEDGKPIVKECVLEIKQNGSSIHVCSYFANQGSTEQSSLAYSIAEEIMKERNGSFSLYYLYTNAPDNMAEALNKHDGTAKFVYLADKKQLVGEYYNHRLNKGRMKLDFEGKSLLHRFQE